MKIEQFANTDPVTLSNALSSQCEYGEASALDIYLALCNLEKTLALLKSNDYFLQLVETELLPYMGRDRRARLYGVEVAISRSVQYQYDATHDPHLSELQAQADTLKAAISKRKEWLKSLKTPQADELSEGVVIEPLASQSKPIIQIFRPKK